MKREEFFFLLSSKFILQKQTLLKSTILIQIQMLLYMIIQANRLHVNQHKGYSTIVLNPFLLDQMSLTMKFLVIPCTKMFKLCVYSMQDKLQHKILKFLL